MKPDAVPRAVSSPPSGLRTMHVPKTAQRDARPGEEPPCLSATTREAVPANGARALAGTGREGVASGRHVGVRLGVHVQRTDQTRLAVCTDDRDRVDASPVRRTSIPDAPTAGAPAATMVPGD